MPSVSHDLQVGRAISIDLGGVSVEHMQACARMWIMEVVVESQAGKVTPEKRRAWHS